MSRSHDANWMMWPMRPNRYLSDLFRLACAGDLFRLRLFPNPKEVTESFSAYEAVRSRMAKRGWALDDRSITMVAVGDGSTPLTAATFAFRTAWRCISVDPRMKVHFGQPERHKWSEIRRLEVHRNTIELADMKLSGKVLIVAVHSHANLRAAVKACSAAAELAVIAIPCCVDQSLDAQPSEEYEDTANLSPKRLVRIWNDARASVAQLGERPFEAREAAGSIPAAGIQMGAA